MTVKHNPNFTELSDNIYINKDNAMDKQKILSLIKQAEERDREFYGDLHYTDDTIFIIFDDKNLTPKVGDDHATQTTPSKKNYICISDEYFEIDIIAHEITHSELHTRLTMNALNNLPTWFNEGLATQNDYREKYSEEQWIAKTDNGKNAADLDDMDTPQEFYAGEVEDKIFKYINAKHEIAQWMSSHGQRGLIELIDKLADGADFYTAYSQ